VISRLGAEPVEHPEELAAGAEAVVICVHNDAQVREICFERNLLGVMASGSTLIVHTTGSPLLAGELLKEGQSRGIMVVDAPVSGGPADIAAGKITVYAGGDDIAFSSARRILSRYADPLVHTGRLGSGQAVKLVNNAIFLTNIEILTAGIEFGVDLGVDETMLIECLQQGSARSFALAGIAGTGSATRFRQAVGEFLDKDLAVVRDVARSTSADLGAIDRVLGASSPIYANAAD
jgi:3-hydroxyisobutyrate dehydrogenase-like beta-hydroxyacid dehydrogenase